MSSPAILQGGYVLPLSRSFTQLLLGIVAQKPPHRHPITGLTITSVTLNTHRKRAAGIRSKYASSLPEKTGSSITSPIFTMQDIRGLSLKKMSM